ncbi:protein transport protein Sec16A isoform X3 [Macrosteles quadrilineatus]|uniref:protein transport protein Sec16A isoform X3 n=1 Tax=Macrosteles quadrilineatus TaxID=74068 RepID=UPI0023E250CA|nr:protein transport protein Sec16A isoform X3 [Macrosteles quadrilineatus]
MWPANPRPPSRPSAGDQFNNNSNSNPYSRNPAVPKTKPGRQSTDPWDWGWEDNNSGQQEDWNNGWGQTQTTAPNVIPNHPPQPSHYQRPPDKKPHGTPDLIPDQLNTFASGRGMVQQQYNQVSNASDFFENIDLVGNHGPPSVPLYNPSQRQVHQGQNYQFAPQPYPSQNFVNRNPAPSTPASYFHPPSSISQNYGAPPKPYPGPPQSNSVPPQAQSYPPQPHSVPSLPPHSASPKPNSGPPQTHSIPSQPVSFQPHSPSPQPTPPPQNSFPPQPYSGPPQPYSVPPLPPHSASPKPNSAPQSHSLPPQSQSIPFQPHSPPQPTPPPPQGHPLPPQQHSFPSQTLHAQNKESKPYHQPPPPEHNQNMVQNSQYFQPEPVLEQSNSFYVQQQQTQPQSNYYFDQNNLQSQDHSITGSFYDQNTPLSQQPTDYYDQSAFTNNTEQRYDTMSESVTNMTVEEVENIEVAPPESTVTPVSQVDVSRSSAENLQEVQRELSVENNEENNIPDNQETVPDNEEHLQNLHKKMSQMKISSTHNIDSWSTGWENQEVAPRCELDRNQYLETGQLVDSNGPEETTPEVDNNDEGEALPPPGLHRMVTGQGTDSVPHRQPPSGGGGFVRLVPGQPTPSASPEPITMERMVPGQQNAPDERMVPGHQMQDSLRLVPGGQQEERMVPGQLSDDENNTSADFERMVPGRMSEHEDSFPRDVEDERMVTGAGMDATDPGMSNSGQETSRHDVGPGIDAEESVSQPPPGLHRLVLGQINSETSTSTEHVTAKTGERERVEETGMQRMVVGQFREKDGEPESEKEKETVKSSNREDDSDSDYNRAERRRHRHRKDSYDDDRKERERDYSSEREYRERGKERRGGEYRKKRDNSYNHSPEYRSDHEDYDRDDFRERRERDRRDRPRERDRRRRSPESYYREEPYYREDPRRLGPMDRDRRYYEPYQEDPYYYRENRSRPSSRTGLEYRRHRDYPPRQPYYPEQGGMDSWNYYRYQQYYENMRRTDPAAYALWYERYMAEKYGNASNDRASVHSGRSSANEISHSQDKAPAHSTPVRHVLSQSLSMCYKSSANQSTQTAGLSFTHQHLEEDDSVVRADETVSHRSTPPLYTSAHVRGQFHSLGQLVTVDPQDPFSYGQHQATVTVYRVTGPTAADTPDTLEFLNNPGPFISGVTHKNTVIQYLKKERDLLTHSSERLLYDLICLVIKLNGVVDMTDVADLLMESYRQSQPEGELFPETTVAGGDSTPLSPHQVTSRFRDLLLEGNKTEALEWAIKNKDWGHALFLASKMDSRTHNNVMVRFANGLQTNDPLQTLYQLMSGHEPQAATCAADKRWGDWRPHLAMMLSNRTPNVEVDRKAILTLGDSLAGRGRLFAAHFCYLTAQLEFSRYSDRQPKLVLLGASVDKPFAQFASYRAIMLTVCYEFAKQLSNKDWCIPSLRHYKFLLACKLIDYGNLPAALSYLEWLSQDMVRLPSTRDDRPLAQLVINMADRVKVADTSLAFSGDLASDPDWLARLKQHVEDTNDPTSLSAQMTHGVSTSTVSDMEPISYNGEHNLQPAPVEVPTYTQPQEIPAYTEPHTGYTQDYYEQPQSGYYDPTQTMGQTQGYTEPMSPDNSSSPEYWSVSSGGGWETQQAPQPTDSAPVAPQVTVKSGYGYFANTEEHKPQAEQPSGGVSASDKTDSKDKSKRRANKTQSGSGWFGGIWDKLALRPKNQMILPDDKNPSIVWDDKTKRWVNTDSTENEQQVQLKPPPKASELNGSAIPTIPAPAAPAGPALQTATPAMGAPNMTTQAPTGPTMANTAPSGLPPPAASTNKYKLQRGKSMKSNYVDVMASNKKTVTGGNNQSFAPMPQAPVTNFFIPAPVSGNDNAPVDFLSPSGPVSFELSATKPDDQLPQLSRSSSASSLSREVTFYMSRRPAGPGHRSGGYGKGNPTFFNPSHYKS